MTTLFGKIFVFVTLFVSLASLGVVGWVTVDERDWANETKAIRDDIAQRNAESRLEALALARVLQQIERGDREMPWDIDVQLFNGKLKSVADTKRDIKAVEEENKTKADDLNKLAAENLALLDEIKKQRDQTQEALNEQKRLREVISPDVNTNPGAKSFRDRLDDYRTAKTAAEEQQEKLKPELFNESVRVSILLQRQEELQKRLAELTGGKKDTKSATQASAKR